MSSFTKDFIRVGSSNAAIIVFGFVTSILTARYLGPEGNGVIAGLSVYPSLFMTFGSLGIRQSTTYFLGKRVFPEKNIKTAITQIWVLTTLVSLIVCYFLMTFFSKSGGSSFLVFLALSPIPFSLFITYNSGVFLGKNDLKSFNRVNWIPPLIVLVLTGLLLVFLNLGVEGALIAAIGGQVFMALHMLFKNQFLNAFSIKIDFSIIKSMLSLGVTYAIALLIINLNYKIDIILLDKLSSSYELGVYSKGSGIIQYLWQIPMLLSTIIFARSATSKNEYAFSLKVAKLLRVSLVFVGAASLFLFFLSDFIILSMYGEDFQGSIPVLNILLPGVLLLTVFKVMNMDLAGKGKPWISMKAMVPALIINVVLNFLWIEDFGAIGASFASTISYSVAAMLFLYFYCKQTKVPYKELLWIRKSDFEFVFSKFNKFIPVKR